MGSNECRCVHPPGGSTSCPEQHVAICIKGFDGECKGRCVPIPNTYYKPSERFVSWLEADLYNIVENLLLERNLVPFNFESFRNPFRAGFTSQSNRGFFAFQYQEVNIAVRYNFSFDPDNPRRFRNRYNG